MTPIDQAIAEFEEYRHSVGNGGFWEENGTIPDYESIKSFFRKSILAAEERGRNEACDSILKSLQSEKSYVERTDVESLMAAAEKDLLGFIESARKSIIK